MGMDDDGFLWVRCFGFANGMELALGLELALALALALSESLSLSMDPHMFAVS